MPLLVLRVVFVMVCVGVAVLMFNSQPMAEIPAWVPLSVLAGMTVLPMLVIAIDLAVRRKDLTIITAVYFGLIVGLFLTYVAVLALAPFTSPNPSDPLTVWLPPVLGTILCYACISVLLQTKDDFRFLIPYVEFARDVKGLRPNVLDASAIVDGRVADLAESGVFESRFVVPSFIVDDLQAAADDADKTSRLRGRRGLDVLTRLRGCKVIDIEVLAPPDDLAIADSPDESRVLAMARRLGGRLITADAQQAKAATVRRVAAINVNDIAVAMKPTFMPGDALEVRLVKAGEEQGQGVGYLEDGTMVVVEGGREHIGRQVAVSVTGTLQTNGGRLVFARLRQSVRA